MALYIVPFFMLQAIGYLTFAYALWVVTNAPERTTAFRILLVIMMCMLAGSLLRALASYFFSTSAPFTFIGTHAQTGVLLEGFGRALFLLGWLLKPLFLRSLRQPINTKNYFFSGLAYCTLVFFPLLLLERLGLSSEVEIYAAIAMILTVCWALLELRGLRHIKDPTLKPLGFALILLIALHLSFAADSRLLSFGPPFVLNDAGSYAPFALMVCVARISLFFMIDTLCLFFWWQHYSTSAVEAQETRKKIALVIAEKEQLVKNLINANNLIQTGAVTTGLSHEINQFLARIQLDVDWAKVQLANHGLQDIQTILNRVLAANSGAAALIQDVKKLFAKTDEELTRCDVDGLIESVAQLFVTRAKSSNISLTLNLRAKIQILVRETLIQQVFSNLVLNAIEALDSVDRQDKKIAVETAIEHGRWVLRVVDNAHGVSPENAHKIFSLFATSKNDGSGVGLWLSRHIVEQHGGYIRFANLEPEGAMFWVEMPIEPRLLKESTQPSSFLS